jgi:hypothetical protein
MTSYKDVLLNNIQEKVEDNVEKNINTHDIDDEFIKKLEDDLIKKYSLPFDIYTCFDYDYFLYKYDNQYIGMFLTTWECEQCWRENQQSMSDRLKEKICKKEYNKYKTIDEADYYIKNWLTGFWMIDN